MAQLTVFMVTGASRGLGLEFVKRLLDRADTSVIATARNPSAAKDLCSLQQQHGSRLAVLELDTADEASIQAAAKKAAESCTHVDVLINNAGIGEGNPFEELGGEEFLAVLKVNVVGPFLALKHFLPLLRAGRRKQVVNVSSRVGSLVATLEPVPPGGARLVASSLAYRTSKAALNYETAYLAKNLGGEGFTVVALHPGWVKTDMGYAGGKIVGREPPLTPTDSVLGCLKVVDGLEAGVHNGKFLSFDGSELPF